MRANEWNEFREGVVIQKKQKISGSFVDAGLLQVKKNKKKKNQKKSKILIFHLK